MFAVAATGCSSDRAGPRSWIQFDAVPNLLNLCDATLTVWTVKERETGQSGTASCSQPIVFDGLAPGTIHTFDIFGYTNTELCWRGACVVRALVGPTLVDCSAHIVDLCP
ncbi:MAG: hypothetical protein M3O50_04215 [Myxococcota bacterium]|nr:hypothetical protein [Myxococcota bacterium]